MNFNLKVNKLHVAIQPKDAFGTSNNEQTFISFCHVRFAQNLIKIFCILLVLIKNFLNEIKKKHLRRLQIAKTHIRNTPYIFSQ